MELSKIGKKVTHDLLKKYQNKNAIREVIGCIMLDPQLLTLYLMSMDDFVEPFHQTVFSAIINMARDGAIEISPEMVDQYLEGNFPLKYKTYNKNNGNKYLKEAIELASRDNFAVNYNEVKKWTLLRQLLLEGIDVSEYYDPDNTDEEKEVKRDKFEEQNLKVIMAYFESKLSRIGRNFINKLDRDSRLAGGKEAHEQMERFKKKRAIELSYASQFMTTVTYGIKRGHLTIGSAPTGVGKTRMSVANMCYSFAPKIYDKAQGKWIDNPHGSNNRALYIGTEMELLVEIEPIIWAYMADVNTDHILLGEYDEGEEERVNQAIDFLRGKDENGAQLGGIYLEYLPSFTVASLESVIKEHVAPPHNVRAVFFDYMFPTAELLNEYRQLAGAMGNREDQALNYLSTKLKEMARAYNVSIDTWTQVNGDWKDEKNRDQTIVRGSKGVIDKADTAFIATQPTKNELDALAPLRQDIRFNKYGDPNLCLTIYKNRAGRYNNVKIWLYVDYGSMRVHDLYTTKLDFTPATGLQKSIIIVTSDGEPKIFTSMDAKEKYEAGELSKETYDKFAAQEKNSKSYAGNFTPDAARELSELENATTGVTILGDSTREINIPDTDNLDNL